MRAADGFLYLQIVGPAALGAECHDHDHNGVSYRVCVRACQFYILYSIDAMHPSTVLSSCDYITCTPGEALLCQGIARLPQCPHAHPYNYAPCRRAVARAVTAAGWMSTSSTPESCLSGLAGGQADPSVALWRELEGKAMRRRKARPPSSREARETLTLDLFGAGAVVVHRHYAGAVSELVLPSSCCAGCERQWRQRWQIEGQPAGALVRVVCRGLG